ncbi:MAG: Phosphorelay intermediate protein [Ramalina farinacea]|uniref:Phosphorelay intermediate protein n=1 Tax=Ramalina farinacea TaxID=258253 RepID=A0AA43TXS6_9LECA|nr:Phosphorelay intermediate protein [Ramalina farinacea]
MDDDEDDRDFSRGIVYGFFEQAEATFENMEKALKDKDLPTLSSLGHFLKGSSATLGLSKVRDSCEKIQHFGARKEADGNPGNGSDAHYLDLVQRTVDQVKGEYKRAEAKLKTFYGET